MSFKEGFTAIEDIQNSGRRLSDTVSRIEALEGKLEGLLKAQARLSGLIGQVEGILTELKNSSNDLATEHARTSEQVQELPSRVASVVAEAEQRIEDRQVHIAVLVDELPRLVDTALKKRLPGLLEGMEARLRDQLRGELKDTRSAIRDTLEVTSNKQEKSLERMAGRHHIGNATWASRAARQVIASVTRSLLHYALGHYPDTSPLEPSN